MKILILYLILGMLIAVLCRKLIEKNVYKRFAQTVKETHPFDRWLLPSYSTIVAEEIILYIFFYPIIPFFKKRKFDY